MNSFGARAVLPVGNRAYEIYRLDALTGGERRREIPGARPPARAVGRRSGRTTGRNRAGLGQCVAPTLPYACATMEPAARYIMQ